MGTNLDHILIFKTNIRTLPKDCDMHYILSNHNAISQWSIDCEDVDCVLRVVSETLTPSTIIDLVSQHGYHCSELE